MKHIFAICIALLGAAQAFSQDKGKPSWNDVAGTWKGYYTSNGTQRAITFVFADNKCSVDMPDEGIKSAAFDVRLCDAGDVHITQQGIGKNFSFTGTPVGDTMQGKYKVGNVCERQPPGFNVQRVPTPESF